jgi:hypothetical protein
LIFRDDEVYATGGRWYAYDEDGKPKPGDLENCAHRMVGKISHPTIEDDVADQAAASVAEHVSVPQ